MLFKRRISKRVFRQLARKNVKKSAKDYFIYFFTLTFAVCLFYTFNSIGEQFQMLGIPDTLNFLSASAGAMIAVSLFVCAIVGFLVVYANRFLMKRRKREFGIYTVLGMDRRDIGHLLMKETIQIGGISLIAGLVLGVFVSQLLSMVTGRLAGAGLAQYGFVLSPKATLAAILFFGFTFVCVHLFNVREIKKMQLLELLYADRKNEEVTESGRRDLILGIVSVLLIAGGYFTLFKWSDNWFLEAISGGGALIVCGTVLFFLSAVRAIVKMLKRRKSIYYRKLNLFVVNQFGSRMKSAGLSIAVVCTLMYLAISIIGVGTGMSQSFMKGQAKKVPYDVSIIYDFGYGKTDKYMVSTSIRDALKQQGALVSGHLKNTDEISFYHIGNLTAADLFAKEYELKRMEQVYFGNFPVLIVGLDDYNQLRRGQGLKPISLKDHEFTVTYNEPNTKRVLELFVNDRENKVKLGKTTLHVKKGKLYKTTLYNRNVFDNTGTIVVPQKLLKNAEPVMKVCNGMFRGNEQDGYDAVLQDELRGTEENFNFENKIDLNVQSLANQLTSSYISIYLGIIFLITAGAVLALQQLAQSSDNVQRYEMIRRMGADEGRMRESLRTQMLLYFGLPFGMAALHSAVTMRGLYAVIPYLTRGQVAQNIIGVSCLACVVYGVYFVTTLAGSKRILKL